MSSLNPKTYNLQHKGARPVRRSVPEGHPSRSNGGFAALTSTIIIAAVLLILAVSVASSGFQGRFSVFDGEVKEVSRGLAEGCVETVRLKMAQDEMYEGEDTVKIGDKSCYICNFDPTDNPRTVFVQASTSNAFTNLKVEINGVTFEAEEWEEIPKIDISGSTCTTS